MNEVIRISQSTTEIKPIYGGVVVKVTADVEIKHTEYHAEIYTISFQYDPITRRPSIGDIKLPSERNQTQYTLCKEAVTDLVVDYLENL